jgi:hypothetical protein
MENQDPERTSDQPVVGVRRESSGWLFRIILVVLVSLLVFAVVSEVKESREAARRTQCKGHLGHIALALHNYHDWYGGFPPAVVRDSNGKPLHSWRTLILPSLGYTQLYERIDLSRPWNDPVNQNVRLTDVPTYRCPTGNDSIPSGYTTYLAIVGPDLAMDSARAKNLDEITDGTENTLVILEVSPERAVPWMAPDDLDIESLSRIPNEDHHAHVAGIYGVFCNGHVRLLPSNVDAAQLRSLATSDGSENVDGFLNSR